MVNLQNSETPELMLRKQPAQGHTADNPFLYRTIPVALLCANSVPGAAGTMAKKKFSSSHGVDIQWREMENNK